MDDLTDAQLRRQDSVDNAIFGLIQSLNPSGKEVAWDIEMISEVRETIQHWLVDQLEQCNEQTFYPYIEE